MAGESSIDSIGAVRARDARERFGACPRGPRSSCVLALRGTPCSSWAVMSTLTVPSGRTSTWPVWPRAPIRVMASFRSRRARSLSSRCRPLDDERQEAEQPSSNAHLPERWVSAGDGQTGQCSRPQGRGTKHERQLRPPGRQVLGRLWIRAGSLGPPASATFLKYRAGSSPLVDRKRAPAARAAAE
jgi:hypothetical protein